MATSLQAAPTSVVAMHMLRQTGFRRNETLTLHRDNVDLDTGDLPPSKERALPAPSTPSTAFSPCRQSWGLLAVTGQPILAGPGPFGPWVRHSANYPLIGDDNNVLTTRLNPTLSLSVDKEN